jgi:hypothetical protein
MGNGLSVLQPAGHEWCPDLGGKMSEVLVQKKIKLPTGHQINFLQDLKRWGGVATTGELRPQTCQADNAARQTCKRRGWVTFDRYYWRLTDDGREALKAAGAAERT